MGKLMVRVMGDGEIHSTSREDVENDDSRDHKVSNDASG
jgi:hypothetical protein